LEHRGQKRKTALARFYKEDIDLKKDRVDGRPELDDQPRNLPKPAALAEKDEAAHEIDANRYAEIALRSKVPLFRFLHVAMKEDRLFLLPRILIRTIKTMRRIPHTFFIKDEAELERYVFQTISQWAKSVLKITKMRLDVRGIEHLKPDQTYLFVSNHRSPADIPVLFTTIPQRAAFVANAIFQSIPAIAYWMRASGSVFIDQSNPKSALAAFKSMARRLRKGRSLILFPEGHMHQGKGIDPFNRGGIFSAVLTGTPIVPICLYGTDRVIRPGSFHINPYKRVFVEFCSPIETTTLGRTEKKEIDAIVHDMIAEKRAFYEKNR
jgi:1-acyl-sn-glycerol-3-phosphate acyltransferase